MGFKGIISNGRMEKICSSMDSSWYCQFCYVSCHILQLIMRDLDPMCSTLITWSPFWNKFSMTCIENLTKSSWETTKLKNPNVSYSRCTTLFFMNWRWDFMQSMKCNDIAYIVLKLIPIPLLHFLSLSKL